MRVRDKNLELARVIAIRVSHKLHFVVLKKNIIDAILILMRLRKR